jgi:NitT/TauT family transport system permease protein
MFYSERLSELEVARSATRRISTWRSVLNSLVPFVLPAAILMVWQLTVMWGGYRRSVLPAPSDILVTWYDLVTGTTKASGRYSGSWFDHVASSLWRVYLGFAWGAISGIVVGLFIGVSRLFERAVDPTVQLMRNIPVTAWVPLSLVFFGIGNAPAIFLIGLGAFYPNVVNTTHGVRQMNSILYKAAAMMGASRREMLLRVILPASLPSIMTGLRLSMGIAWVLVVVAEILAVRSGLGYLLNDAYQFYRNDVVIAAMISIGALGFLSDVVVVAIRNKVRQWNQLEVFSGEN